VGSCGYRDVGGNKEEKGVVVLSNRNHELNIYVMEEIALIIGIIGSFASIYALIQAIRDFWEKKQKRKAIIDLIFLLIVGLITCLSFYFWSNSNNFQEDVSEANKSESTSIKSNIDYINEFHKINKFYSVNDKEIISKEDLIELNIFLTDIFKNSDGHVNGENLNTQINKLKANLLEVILFYLDSLKENNTKSNLKLYEKIRIVCNSFKKICLSQNNCSDEELILIIP